VTVFGKNNLLLPGFKPRIVQPVACRCTHHALLAPETYYITSNKHESDTSYAGVCHIFHPVTNQVPERTNTFIGDNALEA